MGGGNGDERVAAPAPLGLRGPEGLSTAEERCGQRDCSRRAELSPPRPWRAAPRRPPPPTRFPVGARFPGGGGGDGLGKRFRFTLETHGCAPSGRRAWAQPWAQRGQARRRAEQRRMLVPALAVGALAPARRSPAPSTPRPAPSTPRPAPSTPLPCALEADPPPGGARRSPHALVSRAVGSRGDPAIPSSFLCPSPLPPPRVVARTRCVSPPGNPRGSEPAGAQRGEGRTDGDLDTARGHLRRLTF
jgi:hypothetical protein